jgi:DNA-binding CsgD family transcriptional regulator
MGTRAARYEAALRESTSWTDAGTADELAQQACASLLRLVPGDGAGWNEIDLRTRTIRVLASPSDYFPDQHGRLAELVHENPLVGALPATRGGAHAVSEFLSVSAYHRTLLYQDVYRPHRVEDQVGAVLHLAGDALIAIAVNRDRRSFSDLDLQLLDLTRVRLAAAYRIVRDRVEARARIDALERALEASGSHVVVLDRAGRVAEATPRAHELIRAWFPSGSPAPGRYVRHDGILVVRRVAGSPPLLLLDERRRRPDPEDVRAFGLTRRESDVVTLAADGLTNAAIARELSISERTVQKHLEHAFRKLGAGNRAEAARRLLG